MVTLAEIESARGRIQSHIHNTPLMRSETLSEASGAHVYVKLESLQKTGAFKVRGIYNKVLSSSEAEKNQGFITASSGNHGLGLAYVCRERGLKSIIVVPEYTPSVKVDAIKRQGAEIILFGKNWNDSFAHAAVLASEHGYSLIHPFDDDAIINGQGTIALEILDVLPHPDYFLASIGGGSMISSNALVFKELSPKTKVIGLQTFGADAMYQSIQQNALVELQTIDSKVESFATKKVSERTFDLAKRCVDEIIRLPDEACTEAMLFMLERTHVLLELSASICVAALLNRSFPYQPGNTIVMVLCGGNVDLKKLAKDIETR